MERLVCTDDYKASFLRSRINILLNVLKDIEENAGVKDFTIENLKVVEKDLRWFRKYCIN